MDVDTLLLAFVSGTVIPLATGILTKAAARPGLKAMISAALSGVTAFVAYLTEFAGVGTWKVALLTGLATWVAHAGSYHGFWKPTGIAAQVQVSTDPVGLG